MFFGVLPLCLILFISLRWSVAVQLIRDEESLFLWYSDFGPKIRLRLYIGLIV